MNEEKDRFGEFIRLLERAREDVYFAEKDRDLLDKLKRRVEGGAQQGQLETRRLKCPRCGVHLHNSILMDFPISRCSTCGGMWIERGVLPRFMNMKALRSASETTASSESNVSRNVWPAGLGGMGKALGGE
jgi:Zn-finger nucleic acid-binding protein